MMLFFSPVVAQIKQAGRNNEHLHCVQHRALWSAAFLNVPVHVKHSRP